MAWWMRPKTNLRQIVNRMVNQQVWPHDQDHVTCAFGRWYRWQSHCSNGKLCIYYDWWVLFGLLFFWPFPVKVYTNPTSLWTIGFMLWKTQLLCGLVDWQNVPTQLLNGILGPSCLFFFVVWIVVTVSVRGDSPSYWCIIIWGYMM